MSHRMELIRKSKGLQMFALNCSLQYLLRKSRLYGYWAQVKVASTERMSEKSARENHCGDFSRVQPE